MTCKCDNCSYECDTSELKTVQHLHERLDHPIDHPDCVVPDGECPQCGALSYEIEGSQG